jgi:hypothetical protein
MKEMRWAKHVEYIRECRHASKVLSKNLKEEIPSKTKRANGA